MKKVVWIVLMALMLTLFSPFSFLVTAEQPLPLLWDGGIAEGFAGGDGSKNDPFRIETAEQFAYFTKTVNEGNNYLAKYIRLCADLRLNDEVFLFDPDTGLVKVTDGVNTAYLGTGRTGDTSGEDSRFDSESSILLSWYDAVGEKIDGYAGKLLSQTPIGSADKCDFRGYFDGAGHTVSGLFICENTDKAGLFANYANCTLEDLHVKGSLVAGRESVGGLVGIASGGNSAIGNDSFVPMPVNILRCSFDGIVVGKTNVGGIVGKTELTPKLSLCENKGVVVGNEAVGGIVGFGDNADECLNNGAVYGGKYTGGIVGINQKENAETIYTPGIYRCANIGSINGREYVGGIVGSNTVALQNCHNYGTVIGSSRYVGGIAGNTSLSVQECRNLGALVKGWNITGGIVGSGNANECYNSADVIGSENYIGGISGYGRIYDCQNTGSVTGKVCVGGVVGTGSAAKCCNYGDVYGTANVGGVFGYASFPTGIGMGPAGEGKNCYNRGSVTATQGAAGGIVGYGKGTLAYCYNTGAVTGIGGSESGVGAIIGFWEDKDSSNCLVNRVYYLKDCATDQNGNVHSAVGNAQAGADNVKETVCSIEEMMKKETYTGFDFANVWLAQSEDLPTLKILQTPHEITQTEDERYLYREASCLGAAQYRTSCSCGAVLDECFSVGEKSAHVFGNWSVNDTAHSHTCTVCAECEDAPHAWELREVVVAESTGEVVMRCSVCKHKTSLPFDLNLAPQEPLEEKPTVQTQTKTAIAVDVRFVLLLSAGGVLGAMGAYGVMIVQKMRKDRKKKQQNIDFI